MDTSKIALYTPADNARLFTPAETIREMFTHTDEAGVLYVPQWIGTAVYDDAQNIYRCVMDWNEADAERVIERTEELTAALARIAEALDPERFEEGAQALPEDLREVWNTYLRDFEIGDLDHDKAMEIADRMETVNDMRSIAARIEAGEAIPDEEMEYYQECKDAVVSDAEEALFDEYCALVREDAEQRVGRNAAAFDVVIRAMRLFRLLSIGAPQLICGNESSMLAQAMALHACCRSLEIVKQGE